MMEVQKLGGPRMRHVPESVLASAAVVMLVGQFMRYHATTALDAPPSGLALLLPWLLLLLAAVLMFLIRGPLYFALLAAAGALSMMFAAPFVIDRLQGFGVPETVWLAEGGFGGRDWVVEIANGDNSQIAIARWIMVAGMLLLFAYAASAIWVNRELLLGPAARASFGVDIAVLLTLFAVFAIGSSQGRDFSVDNLWSVSTYLNDPALGVRLLSWLVPLMIWLALTCRQGGALVVGSTAGLCVALLLVPSAINLLADRLGAASQMYAISNGSPDSILRAYDALDWMGAKPWLGAFSAVLLLVALWWALGVESSARTRPMVASASSPTNWLAVVSFILVWVPLTSIAGIVTAHMAYDQVATSAQAQRGMGLARWSIVLGYVTVVGSILAARAIWF